MKKITVVITLFLMSSLAFSQGYNKGDNVLGLNIGFGNTYAIVGANTYVPPLELYYEAGVSQHISVGGFIGYTVVGDNRSLLYPGGSYVFKFRDTYTLIGARGTYHFGYLLGTVEHFDLYGGLSLGYAFSSSKVNQPAGTPDYSHDIDNAGFRMGVYAGARYYFNNGFGLMGEVGYGMAILKFGGVYKF